MIDVDIMESVATAIFKALNVPIYFEHKENNMQFPCVYIKPIEPSMNLHRGDMYEQSLPLDIMYYANELDVITDTRKLLKVPQALFDCLEYIGVHGRTVRGQNMKYRITDGVLHFFVTYENVLIRSSPRENRMEHMTHEWRLKNG